MTRDYVPLPKEPPEDYYDDSQWQDEEEKIEEEPYYIRSRRRRTKWEDICLSIFSNPRPKSKGQLRYWSTPKKDDPTQKD